MEVHKTKVNNLTIEYIKKGSGPDLLFLHGGAGSFRTYGQFINVLSKEFTVWAPSIPGAGRSSWLPKDWRFEDYSKTIKMFAEKMNIKPFLMGHSFGGAVAIKAKFMYPNSFKDLVLISSAGMPASVRGTTATISSVIIKQARHLVIGHPDVKKDIISNFFCHPIDTLRLIKYLGKLDLTEELNQLKGKVIVLWADKDEVLPSSLADYFRKNIRDIKIFVLKGTHIFMNIQAKKIRGILKYEFDL